VRDARELQVAVREVALPALLKTSRLGYDGKGQAPVDRLADAEAAFRSLGGVACVLEQRLALETEVSVVLARGDDGAVAAFPVGENRHRAGILETTVVPAQVGQATLEEARSIAWAHLRQRAGSPSPQQRTLYLGRLLRGSV
jgi:5-(carboxyamino)imidazole ribonucleotide synthase